MYKLVDMEVGRVQLPDDEPSKASGPSALRLGFVELDEPAAGEKRQVTFVLPNDAGVRMFRDVLDEYIGQQMPAQTAESSAQGVVAVMTPEQLQRAVKQ